MKKEQGNNKKIKVEEIDEDAPLKKEQIVNLLYELSKTHYWKAIQQYNLSMDYQAIQSLAVLDPFKKPTEVARSQGIRTGIYYIEQVVKHETERRQRIQAELDKK